MEGQGARMGGGQADHGQTGATDAPIPFMQNGCMGSGTSMLNMLGPGAYGKATPLEAPMMTPAQEQMLIQGPMLLQQLNSVAEYMAAKGDFPNAIRYYERITALDPENGACWTALGHCYLLTDELQKAFAAYQKALYSLPDVRDPQLWYGIGLLYDKVPTISSPLSSRRMSMRFRR
jgi:tetratricopeptide (TPR) repeat protein